MSNQQTSNYAHVETAVQPIAEELHELPPGVREFPSNVFKVGGVEFESISDRLLFIEDEFRSGYECLRCIGKQWITCDQCGGSGKSRVNEIVRCSACQGQQRIACPDCSGKGVVKGGLIIPQAAERRPTTGRLLSVGPRCKEFTREDIGKNYLYMDYTGQCIDIGTGAYDLEGTEIKVVLRVVREADILQRIKGHLELRRIKKQAVAGTE